MLSKKTYLGDGVYAAWDGEHIILTLEDGAIITNLIFLDSQVRARLKEFICELDREAISKEVMGKKYE
jgi:hypothetical protein